MLQGHLLRIQHSGIHPWALILCLCWVLPVISQEVQQSEPDNFMHYIEQVYGSSDLVFQGKVSGGIHVKAAGNPYFGGLGWTPVTLYISGSAFSGVTGRYDVFRDRLLLQLVNSENEIKVIESNFTAVDSFFLDGLMFVNFTQDTPTVLPEQGYRLILYRGQGEFSMKISKDFIKTRSNLYPYGFFSEQKQVLLVEQGSSQLRIHNKRELLRSYTPYKKDIRQFFRASGRSYSRLDYVQLINLCKLLDTLGRP